jgi:D-aminoacyl-tRNA deacylase
LRAVVQRVSEARVVVAGEVVAEIGAGLCVLLGVGDDDDPVRAGRLAHKVAHLRIFENDEGKLDRSLLDTHGSALAVSQFTLSADSKHQKGTRPDFSKAAPREVAEPLYEAFVGALRDHGLDVQTGIFGAYMQLELVNDGPVTIIIET